jgi:pyrroloquinoline quinone (PQQ) biosynthesis protein C
MDGEREDVQQFMEQLNTKLQQPGRSSLHHPVVEDIVAGKLSREQLRSVVAQQYQFTRLVPKLVCLRYGQVTDPEVLQQLEEVIEEELTGKQTGSENHVRLQEKMAVALGMTLDELKNTKPYPETKARIYWQELIIRSRPWFLALGAKYGDEGQVPPTNARLVPALKKHYGLRDEEIAFVSVHIEADAKHGSFYENIIRKYIRTPALTTELEELVLTAAELNWDMRYAAAYRDPRKWYSLAQ